MISESQLKHDKITTTYLLKELFFLIIALIGNLFIGICCWLVRVIKKDTKTGLTKEKVQRIRYMDGFKKSFFKKHKIINNLLRTYYKNGV